MRIWWALLRLKWVAWKCRHPYSRRVLGMAGLEVYSRTAFDFHLIRLCPGLWWAQFGFLAFRVKIA